jgi:mobilization protein NikA
MGAEAPPMPFRKKGAAGLTERLDVRVAPAEKAHLRALAEAAGIVVADLVRRRALGRPVVSRTDATTIRELRRLGGLLKMVHVGSGGAYSRETAAALNTLHAAIRRLASGDGAAP